jgi:hypothetical protein
MKLFNPGALHLLHFLNPNSYADKFGVRVVNRDAIVGHLPLLDYLLATKQLSDSYLVAGFRFSIPVCRSTKLSLKGFKRALKCHTQYPTFLV